MFAPQSADVEVLLPLDDEGEGGVGLATVVVEVVVEDPSDAGGYCLPGWG